MSERTLERKGLKVKLFIVILGCGLALTLPVYFTVYPYASKSLIPYLLGIIGSAMMAGGALFYVVRKRVKALKNFGKMKHWLDIHILLCLLGPLLVVYHSAFTVEAPNSAIAYYAMLTIVASGVFGRYIYRHFQFSLSGERATLKEMKEEAESLDLKINEHFSESQNILETVKKFFELKEARKSNRLIDLFFLMIRLDWLEKRLRRKIKRFLRENRKGTTLPQEGAFEEALMKRISLERKISALEGATKLFSFWHRLHVPLIWILLLTFIAHVAAVLIF